MKTKQLKVYESCNSSRSRSPKILMEGKWLESLGFHIGNQLQITYSDNYICIQNIPSMVCEETKEFTTKKKR